MNIFQYKSVLNIPPLGQPYRGARSHMADGGSNHNPVSCKTNCGCMGIHTYKSLWNGEIEKNGCGETMPFLCVCICFLTLASTHCDLRQFKKELSKNKRNFFFPPYEIFLNWTSKII